MTPFSHPVLVTGATGFLGRYLLESAPGGQSVLAGVRNLSVELAGNVAQPFALDLTQPETCYRAVLDAKPSAIIHAAAMADTGACERDPELSRLINVEASVALARAAAELQIPIVFCSTDLVFGGDNAPYAPSDPVKPLMVYGRHKAEAEVAVLESCPTALIARLPLMYGLSPVAGRGMIADLLTKLKAGEPVNLFTDEYRTMAHGARVAEGLWMAIAWQPGTWHFGGPVRVSRYQFGQAVARAGGLDASLVQGISQLDVKTGTPRPADVSLDSAASYALGWGHGGVGEELGGTT